MKTSATNAASTLFQTLCFTGLSGEQALLATLVTQNPATDPRIRQRARSLLLLNDGDTVAEAARKLAISPNDVSSVVRLFSSGGFCHAVLGDQETQENRVWLTLSPSSPPRVRLQPTVSAQKRTIDTAVPAATSIPRVPTATLSLKRQARRFRSEIHHADRHHSGGQSRTTPHA